MACPSYLEGGKGNREYPIAIGLGMAAGALGAGEGALALKPGTGLRPRKCTRAAAGRSTRSRCQGDTGPRPRGPVDPDRHAEPGCPKRATARQRGLLLHTHESLRESLTVPGCGISIRVLTSAILIATSDSEVNQY